MPAITQIGSTVTNFDAGKTTSIAASYTQAAGTSRVLVVIVGTEDSGLASSVTFDGVSLTKEVEAGTASRGCSIWYLVNPPVKTADVVANLTDSADASLIVHSWDNVHQTTPFRASAAATGSGNPSVVSNSAVGDRVIDGFAHDDDGTNPSVGAGQTELADVTVTGDFRAASSHEDGASPNVTMSWTAGSGPWSHAAGSLQQAEAGWQHTINGVSGGKVNEVLSANIGEINEVS